MNRQEFLVVSGIERETLEVWIEQHWILPRSDDAGERFGEVDAARVRLIRELKVNIGANDAGIDIILHLMDQLHGARQAMEDLRRQMGPSHDSNSPK